MSTATLDRYADCLSGSWLAVRLGVDVVQIEAMRRAGELIAVRPQGRTEWLYPAWQFDGDTPRPAVRRIVAAARDAGLDERELYDVLTRPLGLASRGGSRGRLADLLVAGEDEQVIAAVRSSSPSS